MVNLMPFLFGILLAIASFARTSSAYSAFDALRFHPAQRSYYSGPEKYERKWLQCMQELQELKRKGYGQDSSEYSYEKQEEVKEVDSDEKNYPPNYQPAFHYEQLRIPDVILPMKIHNVPSYPQRMAKYSGGPMRGSYPAAAPTYGQSSQQPQHNYAQKPHQPSYSQQHEEYEEKSHEAQQPYGQQKEESYAAKPKQPQRNYSQKPQQPSYSQHHEESGQKSHEAQQPYGQQKEASYEEKPNKQEYEKPEQSSKSGSKERGQYQEEHKEEYASKEYSKEKGYDQKSASKEDVHYKEENHKTEEYGSASKEYSKEEGYDHQQKSASKEDGQYQKESHEAKEYGSASTEYSKEGSDERQNMSDEPYGSDEATAEEGSSENVEESYSREESEEGYGDGQQPYPEELGGQPINPPPPNMQPGQPQPMPPNGQSMPPQVPPQQVQQPPVPQVPAQVPAAPQNEQAALGIPEQQPVPPPVDPAAQQQPAQQGAQPASVQQEGNTTCKLAPVEVCSPRATCPESGQQVQKDCSLEGDDLVFDGATQDCKSIDSVPECTKDAYCGSTLVQMGQRTLIGGNCSKMAYLCGVPSVDNGQDGRLICKDQNIVNPNNLDQCIARSEVPGC